MDDLYHETHSRWGTGHLAMAQVEWPSETASYAVHWVIWRSLMAEIVALQAGFPWETVLNLGW